METSTQQIKKTFQQASQATLTDALEAFVRLELAGLSEETVRFYQGVLGAMIQDLGADRAIGDVMEVELAAWQNGLFARKHSAYTINGYTRAVKRFFHWLYQKDLLAADLGKELKPPKLPRTTRRGIAEDNLETILEAAQKKPRDYALLLFLESTGCRRSGAANLKLSDLDLSSEDERLEKRVFLMEKGDKERIAFLSDRALEALKAWLKVRPASEDERVFMLSPTGVSGVLRRYKARLGLSGACSPHQWRHRFSRKALMDGMDLSQVSHLLGHENITITAKFYGQFTLDQLQEAYDKMMVKRAESR